jgi:hypothetical protein
MLPPGYRDARYSYQPAKCKLDGDFERSNEKHSHNNRRADKPKLNRADENFAYLHPFLSRV